MARLYRGPRPACQNCYHYFHAAGYKGWSAMKNFGRALREAWRYWPALTIALFCSLGVAVLWGANIAALFPIIETTLHGQSLQEWNQKRLENAEKNLADHEKELADLVQQRAAAANENQKAELGFQSKCSSRRSSSIAPASIRRSGCGLFSNASCPRNHSRPWR